MQGVREGLEALIESDEAHHLRPSLVVQLLEGDLTNDLVAKVTPGLDWGR